jgi:hypothetical protein
MQSDAPSAEVNMATRPANTKSDNHIPRNMLFRILSDRFVCTNLPILVQREQPDLSERYVADAVNSTATALPRTHNVATF